MIKHVRPTIERLWLDITTALYTLDRASYDKMLALGFEVFPEHHEDELLTDMRHPALPRDFYEDEWDEDDEVDFGDAEHNTLYQSLIHTMVRYRERGYTL